MTRDATRWVVSGIALVAALAASAGGPSVASAQAAAGTAADAATAAPVVTDAVASTPEATETTPAAKTEDEIFRERLALERLRLRVMLAKARMQRPFEDTPEEEPRVHGDAGAPVAVGVGLEQGWTTDRGYDLFAGDDVTAAFGAWASYDLVSLRDDLIFAAELGWGYARESESAFGGDVEQAELRRHRFHGGGRLRWVPLDFLEPHLRVAGGADWTRWSLETPGARRYEDWDISPLATVGAGVLLRSPTRAFEGRSGSLASLSVGVMIEGGFLLLPPLGIALDSDLQAGDVTLAEPSLGEVTRSGPYLRTSVVVSF